ncbi:NADH dehydrogenase subunit 4 [Buchnera aphidicola str. Bp (Baizongia pistaciae)]|uniref:NADH-quinone oxidoreductase subunit M n=1 Tax=Buchnera aphidicola subsp. Baizongia pistaciae (strain Bp) TaxID=224915 RepID=NUOM_BUCBP|nr:NADH-quinone oxidoreductase subunit M [Buchnera aphidicola]Q89AT5.1 RecName: Full=NADH-quinone oxidoreductase subunit M; AltName: Full=NADH dehydrogenase I subunit M; AltName: Full=NDH-1 subunit M [Buchnera aphidicola str. Bp (Baizongia pistaciae)]AAO26888.1 NADH dehydrogenase subunit 4 [Buchnera aphidicola str. Bp (Baizongia pistaciae)]
MLLPMLVSIPFFGGFLCLLFNQKNAKISYYLALTSMALVFILSLILLFNTINVIVSSISNSSWSFEYIVPWIEKFGISFHLAVDRLSILMLNLTSILGLVSVFCSWKKVQKNIGLFYFGLLWTLGSIIGIFISVDLFLFFCFWELSVLPTYFLMIMWGYKDNDRKFYYNNIFSANKFFIYSQISGLVLLLSTLVLVYTHYIYDHILTFDYDVLKHTSMNIVLESCIMLGFFLAFAIKIPIVPFHSWLPDFHCYSPVIGVVDISGILLKTSIYALMRFNIPLFPHSTEIFSSIIMFFGIITIFYGAIVSLFQNNIKRFIAYVSISHMGFILIAIYSINQVAYQGAIIQLISYSLSTAALFLLSGHVFKSISTFDIDKMGGLWSKLRWIPGFLLIFSIINLGVPGTGNFVGEFMIFMGCFNSHLMIVILSIFSLILLALCSLMFVQKICFGPINNRYDFLCDLNVMTICDFLIFVFLLVLILIIGLYPNIIIDVSYSPLCSIRNIFSNFI